MSYNWFNQAKTYIGIKEIPGPNNNPIILQWLKNLKAWWQNDDEAWCGTFVAQCLKEVDIQPPKLWMRALEYNEVWGVKIDNPIEGCIVTFSRKGGGHVGFVAGTNKQGQLVVLGGNQNNMVNYATFDKERVVGYYLPKGYGVQQNLPLFADNVDKSLSEA
jgi:uncharacterized protein (TIGR02594 family)